MNQASAQVIENSPEVKRQSLLKRSLNILGWVILVVLLVSGFGIWYWYNSAAVVDREIASAADFTVYSPRQAPSGYQLEAEQTSLNNDILTYKFTSQSNRTDIVVTVQDRPEGFSMSEISKGGSISSTAMSSGTLYDLSTGDTSKYLLDTGLSLVYITSSGSINTATINSLVNNLRKIN